jgi:hypothetical protein
MDTEIKLSANQKRFIKIAEKSNLEIDYTYSGRGMYGKRCPCVRVDNLSEWDGNPHKFKVDSMGLGYVIYAQD